MGTNTSAQNTLSPDTTARYAQKAGSLRGNFGLTVAGGVPASRIAKWDGASWSALGSGLNRFEGARSLAVFDDGTGPALYAGGGVHHRRGRACQKHRQMVSATAALSGMTGGQADLLIFQARFTGAR